MLSSDSLPSLILELIKPTREYADESAYLKF